MNNELDDIKSSEQKNNNEIYIYTCDNCDTQILTDINTNITSCIYCKNTSLSKNKLEEKSTPKYLIPFKINRETAIKLLKKHFKSKWLVPKEFKIKNNKKYLSGIYVPFWVYDFESAGEIEFECDKVSSWKSSGYKYTKTDQYTVIKGGNIFFESLLIDSSKKLGNEIMDSIVPFDYNELKEFNTSYISNFFLVKSKLSRKESINEASNKIKKIFSKKMKEDIKDYDKITEINNSINLRRSNSFYVLLPIWFLGIKYNDKLYKFAINGQTGKITGNIPINAKKVIFIWIILFISIFIILVLLNLLKVIL